MKIVITSDLHYDLAGQLTPAKQIEILAEEIAKEEPQAVILAGDLSHGIQAFRNCIACFQNIKAPLAVLAGNHDIWKDKKQNINSATLWEHSLAQITREENAIWLEDEIIRLGSLGIIGTLAWYDYSGVDPTVKSTPEQLEMLKYRFNNDAVWIDWEKNDREFAKELQIPFLQKLKTLADDQSIQSILVVTHVPLLEEQMVRQANNESWGLSNAYFGNLTLGKHVLKEAKVRAIVSGHTHMGKQAIVQRKLMEPVSSYVVQSDYGEPGYLCLTIENHEVIKASNPIIKE